MPPLNQIEVHDSDTLMRAKAILKTCASIKEKGDLIFNAVKRNAQWRGADCINLLAPEAPTSTAVRTLLASEIGTRAAEGHIGPTQRWFAGTRHIDEVEALCVELLKELFHSNYAEHRLCASMIGNAAVYSALTQPGDSIMSISQPFGGHSSNRVDGPAGMRGLKIHDIPMNPLELEIDLERFREIAKKVRPKVVSLGLSMALFPFPLQEIKTIIQEWNGVLFFDGAHQLGLIAGGQYQDPLREGATVMTGSAGKTFSGPQSGIMVWNDPEITPRLTHAVFPVWAATHQVNRVAALAYATAEMLAFGKEYMSQIVKNAQALGAALHSRGIPILAAHKNFTRSHQVIADVRKWDGGLSVARLLETANIITNKNLIPGDRPENWDHPSGLRMGTTELTRLGMREPEMEMIAELIASILIHKKDPNQVKREAVHFRSAFQKIFYCFENGLPDF